MPGGKYLLYENYAVLKKPRSFQNYPFKDMGSPLICEDTNDYCGIASWAYGCTTHPVVYTEIYEFIDWIHAHM